MATLYEAVVLGHEVYHDNDSPPLPDGWEPLGDWLQVFNTVSKAKSGCDNIDGERCYV